MTFPLTLTPWAGSDAERVRLLREYEDLSETQRQALTPDEIETLCTRIAAGPTDRFEVACSLLMRLIYTIQVASAPTDPALIRRVQPEEVPVDPRRRILAALTTQGQTLMDVATALGVDVEDDAAVNELRTHLYNLWWRGEARLCHVGGVALFSLEPSAYPLTAPTTHTSDERTIERGYEDGERLRREMEHARSLVRGPVGGGW